MNLRLVSGALVALGTLALGGCSSPTSAAPTTAPTVATMKIGIDDRSQAPFFEGTDHTIYLAVDFLVGLDDPLRWKSVDRLSIEGPTGRQWSWNGDALASHWSPDRGRFEFWNDYDAQRPDSFPLGTYRVTLTEAGKADSTYEMVAYLRNDPSLSTGTCWARRSGRTPFVTPMDPSPGLSLAGNTLTVSDSGSDPDVYGVFLYLFDAGGQSLGGYDLPGAWPLSPEAKTNGFSLPQVLTDAQKVVRQVVVGYLWETHLASHPTQVMMYRSLEAISLP